MLFQIDLTGADDAQRVFDEFWDGRAVDAAQREFGERLVRGVVARRVELDALLARIADRWRVERMAVVDRNVLRLALFEMIDDPETPRAVIIDEAIEIGKKYGSEESGKFINGILDAARRAAEDGTLGLPADGAPGAGG